MPTTVEIDIEKIKAAITASEDLASDIDTQRLVAKASSPVHLPTLGDDTLGKTAEWLENHLEDLTMRRDLAILLDTEGTGSATYTIPYDSAYNVKQMLSKELASQLGDLDHDSDADDYERISAVMAQWQDDPEMMAALFDELGPDGTVAALSNISSTMGYGVDPEAALALAEQIRTGLSSASNDPGFDSEQFAQDVVRYSVVPLLTDEEWEAFQEEHGGISMSGANILTFLMEDTTYSDDFLLSAAAQLEEFEKMAADGPMDATFWYSHNGFGPLPTGDGEYDGWHDDPMAAIMHNLGENPDAGLKFFTEDTGDFNRQMYYFDQRNWEADGYAGISHAAEGIGTDRTNLEDNPEATTALVSNFFDLVANSEGFNPEDATAASPYVSDLMKFYMPAVDNALRHPNTDGTGGSEPLLVHGIGEFEHYPVMFTADLDSLMGVAMSTQEGTQNIAEGIGTYQQTQLNNLSAALAEDPGNGALLTQMKGALQHSAALQGFAEYTVGTVEIEGAASRDAQRQAFIDLVGDASSLVPLPGADVVGKFGASLIDFGFDQAVDLGKDAAGDTFTSEEAAAIDNADERAAAGSTRVKISAFLALVESGAIPEESIPTIWQDDNGGLVDPADIPPDRISLYSQSAMDSIMNHAESTDFDLEGPYESEFQSYYQPASGD